MDAEEHMRFKPFNQGDLVMVYLFKEQVSIGEYKKLVQKRSVWCPSQD